MALTPVIVSFDISDLTGTDFDPRRTKVYATTNIPGGTVVDTTGNKIRLGSGNATLGADGTGSISLWAPGAGSNPASWQTTIHVDYPDRNSPRGRATRSFGPFTIAASGDLADLVDEQEVPPTYVSTVTAQLDAKVTDAGAKALEAKGYRDQAASTAAGVQSAVDAGLAEIDAKIVEDLGTTDAQTKALIESPTSQTKAVLTATSVALIKSRVGGLLPAEATSLTETPTGTNPRVVDVFGGYTWGRSDTGAIYRSANDGQTWTLYATPPASVTIRRIVPTSDGEVLVVCASRIYKTTGWATGTPTFTQKVTPNATCTFMAWGIDGDGTRFITTEYSGTRADSRYVRMTLDAGETWNVVYDSVAVHGATKGNGSHLHGCCYDPYADRWYFTEGHDDGGIEGDIAGVYCSTDNGATWTRAAGMAQNPGPTVLVATPDGLVCGSDNQQNGLYGVRRASSPSAERLRPTWRWQPPRPGLVGFATRGFTDPTTGLVYMGFTTAFSDVAPIIAAGTVDSGGLVYTWPTLPVTNSDTINNIVIPPSGGQFIADSAFASTPYTIRGKLGAPRAIHPSEADSGRVLGGTALIGDSLAVGKGSSTANWPRCVAVGITATAGSTTDGAAVAVGYLAQAVTYGTAMGDNAKATGSAGAVGIGRNSEATAQQTVAVGMTAKATANLTTALGHAATASSAFATAVGSNATVSTLSSGTALGANATVTHTHGVAIGRSSATTRDYQVAVGPRHFEIGEIATLPTNSPADTARLYVADNGSGKTGLYVRFPTGAAIQLAVEA